MFSSISLLRWSWGARRPARGLEGVASQRFEALVDAHLDAIYRTARRLGVRDADVEDVVQEVLVVLARRMSDIEVGKERAFAVGATVRIVANFRRQLRRRAEVLTEEVEQISSLASAPHGLSGEQRVEAAQALEVLHAGLEAMTEAQRVTYVLFELEELRASEIAVQLDVDESAVVSRLHRARRVMRRVCERHGFCVAAVREVPSEQSGQESEP